jgi:Domain of unknown function (DUF4384)
LDNPPRVVAAIWLTPLLVSGLWAQKPGITARDLYYEDAAQHYQGAGAPAAGAASKNNGASAAPAIAAVPHLGLRYNLVKIDPGTRAEQAVDPDANFKAGDCFAIEFTPNQDGRLYVFNLGSSGKPQFLMPSPDMPNEASAVLANATIRIPRDFCFQLDGKRGVETLTVVTAGPQEVIDQANQQQTIAQVREWQGMAGRDILIEKVAEPEPGRDRPYTVYAVDNTGKKSGHVVIELKIHHE